MSDEVISGVGFHVPPGLRRYDLLFEAANAATEPDGKPAPAGCRVKCELKAGHAMPSAQKLKRYAEEFAANPPPSFRAAGITLRPVTWTYFKDMGYHQ